MPTEIATLCFHTRDAVARSEGSFTFDLPSHSLRNHSAKMALASCEFPMVQQTIEAGWNRFYYMESLRLTSGNNTLSVVVERSPGGGEMDVYRLNLPPRWNDASVRREKGGGMRVETTEPHNLFGADRQRLAVFSKLLLASEHGDVDLEDIEYIDETSFRATVGCNDAGGSGLVFCPCIVSPLTLATVLTECARRAALPLSFVYDDPSDRIVTHIGRFAKGTKVRVLPGDLASLCGLSTVAHRRGDAHEIASTSGGWFGYGEMPSGFYSPCHRSMCVGQPLPFGAMLEMTLNRYYFPLLGGGSSGNGPTSHLLVFTNPDGGTHTCTISPGRYTPEVLAMHLGDSMTTTVRGVMGEGKVEYTVRVDADQTWKFECKRKIRGEWREGVFGILFHHPLSVDPLRFGFSPHPLGGASSYTSSASLRTPPGIRNLIRFSEEGPRKRFRVHAVSIPCMVGVVTSCDRKTKTIVYSTFVNRNEYVSGLLPGDAVRLSSYSSMELEDGGGTATATPLDMEGVHTCLVEGAADAPSPVQVCIRVPASLFSALSTTGSTIQIVSDCEPWCIHVGKEKSLPPHMLGWRKGGVLWGRDGANDGLPPYEAPHVHSLDHPDYVCMTFSEMAGANLVHTYDHISRPIFCKLSLYPLFREERMLPRDTSLLSDNMASFTLSFWNPDMVMPYHFHGAEFSFSLAFFSAVPNVGNGGGE